MGGIPFWKWSGQGRQNGAQDSAEALSVPLFDELTNKMCDLRDGKEAGDSETEKKPTGQQPQQGGGCGHLCNKFEAFQLNRFLWGRAKITTVLPCKSRTI